MGQQPGAGDVAFGFSVASQREKESFDLKEAALLLGSARLLYCLRALSQAALWCGGFRFTLAWCLSPLCLFAVHLAA